MNHEIRANLAEHENVDEWRGLIEQHLKTGETVSFRVRDYEALLHLMQLVGHDEGQKRVLGWYYTADGRSKLVTDMFTTDLHAAELQERIADTGMMNEFPNDFDATMAIAYDNRRMVVYRYGSSSEPVICVSCRDSDDPNIQEELALNEGRYGCGHADDEYYTHHRAQMMVIPMQTDDFIRTLYDV